MGKQASFYAVQAGNKPGVYTTWAQCQQQTKGFSGAKYQKFNSKAEAEAFVKSGKVLGNVKDAVIKKTKKDNQASKQAAKSVSKRQSKVPEPVEESSEMEEQSQDEDELEEEEEAELEDTDEEEGEEIENEEEDELEEEEQDEMEDENGDEEDVEDLAPSDPATCADSAEIIYTSGISRGRGRKVCAGLGVYFGEDSCNISERLPGSKQNNKRAELTAGIRALENAPTEQAIEIHTASIYLVQVAKADQGVTELIPKLAKEGWLTAKGTEVENRDLLETLDTLVSERKVKPQWIHVADQTKVPGIERANELAAAGASLETSE
ncbi:hypothetical protein DSO57_1004040 [Entomophthora muscae]|uniref:Uncharacterized protein n=1 Tax=Entomophthora muscae TaxID=34485 RepID=A0ACC2U6K0_9FUNG|nr:hypothetical protein DSO57_1004040 [Entomophthora muscae]